MQRGIFENHVCAFGEGCLCSGHMYGSAYRDPDMGIHTGAFLRNMYVLFGVCPCSGHMNGSVYRDPEIRICIGVFLRTTYVRLEGGVLALGICMEACVGTLTWAYAEGRF